MLEIKDIEKLAELARIALSQEEKEKMRGEMESILDYVGQIKTAVLKVGETKDVGSLRNVLRNDVNPNKSGENTSALVSEMPKKSGNYLKVKKIL